MKSFFGLLLLITFITSCNQPKEIKLSNPLVLIDGLLYSDSLATTPFTGRHKSMLRELKIEYEVVNGIREGDFLIYFANDKIQMVGKMKGNKNIGEWKYYFPSGALQTSGFFENDIPGGKWTWYSNNGNVMEEGNFINGNREGEWKNYDSTGRLDIVRLYKENKIIDSTKVN